VTLEAIGVWQLAFVAVVMVLAAFVHGALGLGFPLIATPLVALALDMKIAIVLVAPVTLVMTLLSVIRGGGWREALARFWYLPITMGIASYAGTRLLIGAKPTPFLLVLAVLILIYLGLDRVKRGENAFVQRHRLAIGLGVGLLAGLFESTANVAVPPLIIYLMLLGVPPLATVQTLNLCFSVGKAVQVGAWAVHGDVAVAFWLTAAALAVPAVVTLFAGMRLRDRIDAATYRQWLRRVLWLMVALLLAQYMYLQFFEP
jgi:hypothetical protein